MCQLTARPEALGRENEYGNFLNKDLIDSSNIMIPQDYGGG